ncbi:MAG: dATP pyrophosphohydrolase [Pseudomonadota bacterium]|nr:dATP pyrophosphohydrolase [Pseudomonadota bacterium]
MSSITIRPVLNKKDQITFLKVPFPIYASDPNWVAPLFLERFEHLSEKKNPYFQHATAQLFIAEKDGKPVGRISAQVCQLHQERYKGATGQIGFLEAADDPAVFAALFKAAEDWLRAKGMKRALGPFSFSINDETGLLIDGFGTMPNMMMGHGTRYYQKRVEEQGFTKAKDVLAYEFDNVKGLPPAMRRMVDRMMASGDLTLRPLNKKNMASEIDVVMDIFNDAWSENWNYIPFTRAEVAMLAQLFKMLLDAKAVQIASWKGDPAAFCLAIANINEWFHGLNGRVLPFGWAKLLPRVISGRSRSVRVPLMGVKKKFQDGAIGAGLALATIRATSDHVISKGVTHGEFSWILEDNLRVRHMLESMGSRVYKTYRIYEKSL